MQGAIVNTRCLMAACGRVGIAFRIHDEYGNVVSFARGGREYFFVNFTTPFNNDAVSRLCKDKEFSYRLLKGVVRTPRTRGFFDPDYADERFDRYKKEKQSADIAREIASLFPFPVIVKMNAGTRGINVYKCARTEEVERALAAIFKKDSRYYDYIALGQEYIPPAREFRVVVFRGKVLLAYEKDISQARFVGNLSPLHYEGARAVHLTDATALGRFAEFLAPALRVIPAEFSGCDIIEDARGNLHLLELNTSPGFYHFTKDNGEELLVRLYENILRML